MTQTTASVVNQVSATVVTQPTSTNGLIIGVNAHLAVEMAIQLAKFKLDLLGLESDWYQNPLFRLKLPSTLQIINSFPLPASNQSIDYLFIFGDHPQLSEILGHPSLQQAKIFLILPDTSASRFYRLDPQAQEPTEKLLLQPYPPFAHLTQLVTNLTQQHRQLLQRVNIRDLLQIVDSSSHVSPLQALFANLPQSQILLAANQSQLVTPLSSEDAAKQLLRLCFSRLRVSHTYTLTGNHQQPLINIAFNLQNVARNQLNQLYDIIPYPGINTHAPSIPTNLITPKRSTNLDQILIQVLQDTLRRHQTVTTTTLQNQTTPPPTLTPSSAPLTNQAAPTIPTFQTSVVAVESVPTPPVQSAEAPSPTPSTPDSFIEPETEPNPPTPQSDSLNHTTPSPPPEPALSPSPLPHRQNENTPPTPISPSHPVKTITKQPETSTNRWVSAPAATHINTNTPPRKIRFTPPRNKSGKSKWSFLLFGIFLLSLIIALILLTPFIFSYRLFQQSQNIDLSQATTTQLMQQINQVQKYAGMTTNNLSLIQQTPLSKVSSLDSLEIKFKLLSLQSQINYQIALTKTSGIDALKIILGDQAGDPYPRIKDTQDRLFLLYGLLTKQLDQINTITPFKERLSTQDQQLISTLSTSLPQARQKVLEIQQALSIYPNLIKPNQKTDILVLLQNHLELRPTGGFVDGVAILSFDSGKLLGVDVHSVYDLDSQLKGQVDPPQDLAELLGETNWFMRDVNWDPDFPNTSRNAEWFLDKELNQPVIATMAETSIGLQSLLSVAGELTLSPGQTVSTQNFLTLLRNEPAPELKSQSDQLPLLGLVYQQLIESLQAADPLTQLKYLDVWYSNFSTNHTRLTAHDQTAMSELVELSWAGQLIDPVCPTDLSQQPCAVDYFSLNEANIGINKANSHINRRQEHTVNLATDATSHSHLLTLTNTAQANNWPTGDYQSYLRAYLPANSQLKRVVVNNQPLESEKITQNSQHGKTIISFKVIVPIQQSTVVEISYTTPLQLQSGQKNAYALLFQRQPGIDANPLQLTTKIPSEFTIHQSTHPFQPIQSSAQFQLDYNQDIFFAVELQP